MTAGGFEAEPWVVARMPDHNDERVASWVSPLETRPDESRAYPSPLVRRHHRDGSKSQNRHWAVAMEVNEAEEGLTHDDPVILGDKSKLGDVVGRVPDQPDEARLVGATESGYQDMTNCFVVTRRLGTKNQAQSPSTSCQSGLSSNRIRSWRMKLDFPRGSTYTARRQSLVVESQTFDSRLSPSYQLLAPAHPSL
jgi:hypothetical protein